MPLVALLAESRTDQSAARILFPRGTREPMRMPERVENMVQVFFLYFDDDAYYGEKYVDI